MLRKKVSRQKPFDARAREIAVLGEEGHRPGGKQGDHHAVDKGQVIACENHRTRLRNIAATHNFGAKQPPGERTQGETAHLFQHGESLRALASLLDFRRNTDRKGARRNIVQDDRHGANTGAITNGDGAQECCSRPNGHVVSDRGVAATLTFFAGLRNFPPSVTP
jgi:hypothetical protein